MKNRIVLPIVIVLSLGTWLVAQRPPPGPPQFARPNPANPQAPMTQPPAPLTTNQVDEMLRALRRAMTNPPAATTNSMAAPTRPVLQTNPPIVSAPSPATPLPTNAPSTPLPRPGGAQTPPAGSTVAAPTRPATNQTAILPPPTVIVPPTTTPAPQIPVPGAAAIANAPGAILPGGAAGAAAADRMIQKGLLQLQGMPLDQFFEIYAMISGRTVLRPYQLAAKSQQITLKAETDWTRSEAIFAMDSALALSGVAMIPAGEKFVKAVPFAEAAAEGAEVAKTNAVLSAESEQFVTRIVELKTVKPTELAPLLATFTRPNGVTAFDANNTVVLRDYASNVKRMLEVIEKVDVLRESDYKLEVIPIKYGKVGDLFNTMSSLISGQAGATGASAGRTGGTGRRLTSTSPLGNRSGIGSSQYGNSGQYGMQPQAAGAIPQSVGGAQNTFQQNLQRIVSRAAGGAEVTLLQDARFIPDERSNSLLIFANKRDFEMITNIVAKVDVLLAQVLIEGIIMEVELNDSRTLGVSMLQNPKNFGKNISGGGGVNNGQPFLSTITNLSGGLSSGFNYFGAFGNNLDVAVSAIAKDSSVHVVSRPRIQTSHAIPGEFDVTEQVPYASATYGGFGYGYGGYPGGVGGYGGGIPSTVQYLNIGVTLNVTPFITPEGLVVMEIEQHASQRGADVIIDGNPNPVVNERGAATTLTVRDGQVIMMGGFITESKNRSTSGVPILKDIPGLGALFRSKNRSNDRRELILLMKATVLKSPDIAAEVAEKEKSQMPGVRMLEEEAKQDAQNRDGRKPSSRKKKNSNEP